MRATRALALQVLKRLDISARYERPDPKTAPVFVWYLQRYPANEETVTREICRILDTWSNQYDWPLAMEVLAFIRCEVTR